jgi:hypothetical protein
MALPLKSWLKKRLRERTSLDGVLLIGIGLVILLASPFAKLAAYGAIVYGAWTIWKKQ